ncbi:MAG: exopolysaccharide biosynthesis protein [Pseudooceanicola sp.]
MSDKAGDARELVEDLADAPEDGDGEVTIGDAAEAIGQRGHSPFIILPMLVGLSPLGGIPSVPTMMAALASFAALAILAGRSHLWLPRAIKRRRLAGSRLDSALDWLRPAADWLDRHFGRRLDVLTGAVPDRIAATVILCLAITVPPSEIIPWAATPQMLAICLFGLAFLMRDGVAMLIAFAISALAFGAFFWLIVY